MKQQTSQTSLFLKILGCLVSNSAASRAAISQDTVQFDVLDVQTHLSPPIQCTLNNGVWVWGADCTPGASTQTSAVTATGNSMPEGIFSAWSLISSFLSQRQKFHHKTSVKQMGNSNKPKAHRDRTLRNLSGLSKSILFAAPWLQCVPSHHSSLAGMGASSSTGGSRKTSFLIGFYTQHSEVLSYSGVQMYGPVYS